jgi:hypothetical protein
MSSPPQPPCFNHPKNIRRRIQVMKFIIKHFSPRPLYLPFRSEYSQHSVLKKPLVYFTLSKWETKFRTHTAQLAKSQFCVFQSLASYMRREDKRFLTE